MERSLENDPPRESDPGDLADAAEKRLADSVEREQAGEAPDRHLDDLEGAAEARLRDQSDAAAESGQWVDRPDPEEIATWRLEQGEDWDKALGRVTHRLRGIDALSPERWELADSHERQQALREANEVLADTLGEPSTDVIFSSLDGPYAEILGDNLPMRIDGQWDGPFRGGLGPIELNDRFLDPVRCPDPREAVTALCHEYRHVFQFDVPAEAGSDAWRREAATYPDGKDDYGAYRRHPFERDSRLFADAVCQSLYGA